MRAKLRMKNTSPSRLFNQLRFWMGIFVLCVIAGCANTSLKPEYRSTMTAQIPCNPQAELQFSYSSFQRSNSKYTSPPSIAALAFASLSELWIAYNRDTFHEPGQVFLVSLPDGQVAIQRELGQFNPTNTHFIDNGMLIASANSVGCNPVIPNPLGVCQRIFLWRTNTGELLSADRNAWGEISDMAFDEQGQWVVTAEGSVEVYDPKQLYGGFGWLPAGDGENRTEHVISTTFNRTGNLIAIGTKQQKIYVEGWNGIKFVHPYRWSVGDVTSESSAALPVDVFPLKLAIDPSTRWLAILSEDQIELRDITTVSLPRQRKAKLIAVSRGVLGFNPASSMLAVGYSQGLRVYSVPDLKQLADKPGAQVTFVAFSPDGCLLAWGDVEGTVHIINAPKP